MRKRQRGLKGTPRSGSSRMPLDGLLDADRSGSQDSSTVLQTPSGSPHQFLSPAEGGRDSAAADIMSNSTPGGSVHHPLTSPGGPDVGGAHGYHLHDLRVTHHPLDQQQLMQVCSAFGVCLSSLSAVAAAAVALVGHDFAVAGCVRLLFLFADVVAFFPSKPRRRVTTRRGNFART